MPNNCSNNTGISFTEIVDSFGLTSPIKDAAELRAGNINTTYIVQLEDGSRFILQRINHYVFTEPEKIMSNIERVTEHLKAKLPPGAPDKSRRVLHFLHTRSGGMIHWDADGKPWRCYEFIGDATAYNAAEKDSHILQTGMAFGDFQRLLADFPIDTLHETIKGFHDTPSRYIVFEEAVANGLADRVTDAAREIEQIQSRRDLCSQITSRLESGELARRVTHNDTKINNVLIDDETDLAVCVIDLDTVMPGSSLYDFGDMIRFGANATREDDPDLSNIMLDINRYNLFADGFISRVSGFMPRDEMLTLPLGVRLITYELAMRFLTDYLNGDKYFKIDDPQHNIRRARAQLRLLDDIERKTPEMSAFIEAKVALLGASC